MNKITKYLIDNSYYCSFTFLIIAIIIHFNTESKISYIFTGLAWSFYVIYQFKKYEK